MTAGSSRRDFCHEAELGKIIHLKYNKPGVHITVKQINCGILFLFYPVLYIF